MISHESLLQSLKDLYAKLHIESLQQRIRNYFLNTHSHRQHDISSTLHQLIDELVKDVNHNTDENKVTENKHSVQQTKNTQAIKSKTTDVEDPEPIIHSEDSLSFYFKNSKAQEKDPSTAVMLRRRIWEHVHSARRLARMGDKKTATFHADIASHGLKTLAHYMPADAHHEFFSVIVKHLSRDSDHKHIEAGIENNNGL